ncbi:MAG: galactokinase [Candidatus Aminicenantes bacterium]|nr:galactokinase [Candidatus Aminicenantes bacterium]
MKQSFIPAFLKLYGSPPQLLSSAPGRINIIGEHTDYNLGYVLPAALNLQNYCLLSQRPDEKVCFWAENFKENDEFLLGKISFSEDKKWVNYIRGIFWVLEQEGFDLQGINGFLWGDIPLEAGLSSSAALEVSVLNGLRALFRLDLEPIRRVKLARRAENEFVGVQCGIMDQFISVFGEKNKALFLDCETLESKLLPLRLEKEGLRICVYESGIKRELASSEYNKRRDDSSRALDQLKKFGASDYKGTTLSFLENRRKEMEGVLFRRARHVITENQRVREAVQALEKDDFRLLGELIFGSHQSLRDDYEVSCPELDLLYEVAREFPGCYGARLTGAGFGGSGIALVRKERIPAFRAKLLKEAARRKFVRPEFYEVEVGEGARANFLAEEDNR